jgi:hypothetical protein
MKIQQKRYIYAVSDGYTFKHFQLLRVFHLIASKIVLYNIISAVMY